MLTTLLISQVSDCHIRWLLRRSSDADLYTARIWTDDTTIQSDILYLCPAGKFCLETFRNAGAVLLTGSKAQVPELPVAADCSLLFYEGSLEPPALLEKIMNGFYMEYRITRDKQFLFRYQEQNLCLQELIDKAHELLENPIILIDDSARILALTKDAAEYREDLKRQEELGYVLEQNLRMLRRDNISEKINRNHLPFIDRDSGKRHQWMHEHVYIDNIEVAHISVIASRHEFTLYDVEIVHFLTMLISFLLQKNDEFHINRMVRYSIFVSELLNHQITSPAVMDYRLNLIDWKPYACFFVFVIFSQNEPFHNYNARLLTSFLADIFPNSRWCIHEGNIVYLLSSKSGDPECFLQNRKLDAFLENHHFRAAISNAYTSLLDTSRFYTQALSAYQTGILIQRNERMYAYRDYGFYCMFELVSQSMKLEDFYLSSVIELQHYDEQHHTELLETLYAYLKFTGNPVRTAQHMHVHKNTILYRINKIKEQFCIPLEDGETCFHIWLTLKLLAYKKQRASS